ncbi:plakophilin 3 L homeolog isoform X1 [Xenopus laevis]|uniref:Plakophilin 3 L homeolog isoform X1 n=1 Tax=Xenopus laevis TaxID=8355 RepID=A0A8J1MUY9_XENLA|nr:plakophilin 3 L homeolog isoform X1 [Xenopus laevis]
MRSAVIPTGQPQPYTDITSLALPTDSQMDRRMREESVTLRNARVQEQVRAKMTQKTPRGTGSNSSNNFSVSSYGDVFLPRTQYGSASASYSSRSQVLNSEPRMSAVRTSGYSSVGGMRPGYSSRSAVDVGGNQRISVASQPRGYTTSRPTSYHEKMYPARGDYDSMSLRSLRIGDGEERYNQGSASQSSFYGRQMSTSSAGPMLQRSLSGNIGQDGGGSSWVERAEVAQTRTIRAPAMRTLQRFQTTNRNRVGSAPYGTINTGSQQQMQQMQQIQQMQQLQQSSGGIGSTYVTNMMEHNSRAPSVRSLAESGNQVQEIRGIDMFDGHKSLMSQHSFTSGFDDMDMPMAVKYLMASDANLQVLGAAYIQHRCYSDGEAKKQARSLQAIPKLVKLLNCDNQEVQRHATGAMRNLIYDNPENKMALVEENGIYELMTALEEPDDELRKNVTGILWNLSSSDNLKARLARDTLNQLTQRVLSPLSGTAGSAVIQQNVSEAEIFYNATGYLRNLSSASPETRQKMRECPGLLDSLVSYTNNALQSGKSEDKSVENVVCVLRNLSYRLYDEMPPSSLQRLEGGQRGRTTAGDMVGCFTPQSRKLKEQQQQQGADIATFTEISRDPKGMELLWHPQIVNLYNRLLQHCELNKYTTEAAAGALQNITAGDRRWASVLSQVALDQERILNPVLDRLRTADHNQLRSLTGLIRNLSRHAKNKDEMSTKLVSHLLEKLPADSGEKCPPAEVLVNIIAILNNLTVAGPLAARDIAYFNGLSKLMYIKKMKDSPDSDKASRAACSLLTNMWQYSKLHREYKAKGYRKDDFLNP